MRIWRSFIRKYADRDSNLSENSVGTVTSSSSWCLKYVPLEVDDVTANPATVVAVHFVRERDPKMRLATEPRESH